MRGSFVPYAQEETKEKKSETAGCLIQILWYNKNHNCLKAIEIQIGDET